MNDQQLDQLLSKLVQPEPSAALDNHIKNAVGKQLALENHYRAELLLGSQSTRLDETTKSTLIAGMSLTREQFGPGFETAYSDFLAQQNSSRPDHNAKQDEPEHGRG